MMQILHQIDISSRALRAPPPPTGQRTIHHAARGSGVLLFVRLHRREGGRSPPPGCQAVAWHQSDGGGL